MKHSPPGAFKLQLDVLDRSHGETAELATKVFELSQTLKEQWLTADYAAKHCIFEIEFLNCRLEDVNLIPTMRKPFDVLVEGLFLKKNRGDWTPIELFRTRLASWPFELRQSTMRLTHLLKTE